MGVGSKTDFPSIFKNLDRIRDEMIMKGGNVKDTIAMLESCNNSRGLRVAASAGPTTPLLSHYLEPLM